MLEAPRALLERALLPLNPLEPPPKPPLLRLLAEGLGRPALPPDPPADCDLALAWFALGDGRELAWLAPADGLEPT